MLKQCVICGKEFDSGLQLKKTCSAECSKKLHSENVKESLARRKAKMEGKEIEAKVAKCNYCGKDFETTDRRRAFCSVQCQNSDQVLRQKWYSELSRFMRIFHTDEADTIYNEMKKKDLKEKGLL